MSERDWVEWHGSYADPESQLSRRLIVVRRRIGEVLDAHEGGAPPLRILSLCAGDGRDLLTELAARPSLAASATLVELDPRLAGHARAAAASLAGVDVREADAGDPATFADVLPVDLLLLCGIFGNVSDDDIAATVAAAPSMLAADGTVIWTRGRCIGDDLRPFVRALFVDTGLTEVAFDGDPEPYGVGVARARARPAVTRPLWQRLFTFVR